MEKASVNKTAIDNPYALNLFFTGKCNLNCRYCFVDKTGQENLTLDEKSLEKSVDILFDYPGKKKTISFNGGEPTIEFPLVKKIYNYAKRKAREGGIILDVALVTNGTVLDQKMMNYFIKNQTILKISIDGNKLTHDKSRPFKTNPKTSSFDKVMENLAKINIRNLRVAASLVFTPENLDHLLENIKFLSSKNFYYIEFYPDLYAKWKKGDLEKFKKAIKRFEVYYVGLFREEKNKKIFKNSLLDIMINEVEIEKMESCGKIHVNSRGEFYVCDKVFSLKPQERKKHVIGNVKDGIDNGKREEMLQKSRDSFFKKSGLKCEKCRYYKYCFCPIGHYIYLDSKKGRKKKLFWTAFCFISKSYSQIFLRIKEKMKYNENFAKLYKY